MFNLIGKVTKKYSLRIRNFSLFLFLVHRKYKGDIKLIHFTAYKSHGK